MANFWTESDVATLTNMLREGKSARECAKALGRTPDSVKCKIRSLPGIVPTIEPEARASMQASSEMSRIRQLERQLLELTTGLKTGTNADRLPVETDAVKPLTAKEKWDAAVIESDAAIKHYHDKIRFNIDFDKLDPGMPVGFSFVSDQHISPGNLIAFRRMQADAELIAETPGLFAYLGGDGVDNHIKIPQAVFSGNHDAWTDQRAGVDMVHLLAQQNRICYSPFEARISAKVGNVTYEVAMRHRYRFGSSFNMLHSVKQWWRMGEQPFDIGVICHDHEAEVGSFNAHSLERWAARPGAYQIGSSFVREYGWNETAPTCPTFIVWPDSRKITGFNDVRIAAKFLKSERGGK